MNGDHKEIWNKINHIESRIDLLFVVVLGGMIALLIAILVK